MEQAQHRSIVTTIQWSWNLASVVVVGHFEWYMLTPRNQIYILGTGK